MMPSLVPQRLIAYAVSIMATETIFQHVLFMRVLSPSDILSNTTPLYSTKIGRISDTYQFPKVFPV